ncbi:Helix-turn-helix domain-containing protein [Asanoa hainanensis]|uniref:Helix-turn-helix domain-containing protein n=1 Tax=Asanoa hainanensis TaxID=560556 RepID=A0A239NVS0_9ACTN|nr:Helix-turn-helix domain-containing protein [Asanoa hainanensis]
MFSALTFWPDYSSTPAPRVPVAVLVPFFNDLLDELPWWNPAWRVTRISAVEPSGAMVGGSGFDEVTVLGEVGDADPQPFVGRVRLQDDRLVRFQAKIGDVVIEPGSTPAGEPEQDPFAALVRVLMDVRGLRIRDVARGAFLSEATIRCLRGGWSPDPVVARRVAEALDVTPEELLAAAGHDAEPDGPR